MPLYIRKCIFCDHEEERLELMSADDLITCPQCHGSMIRKIAAASFIVNGYAYSNNYSKEQQ